MAEYIDREALPLKEWTKTAQMFSDDIICAVGTDFLNDIAGSENKMLFEIIEAIKSAPTADVAEVRHGEWINEREHSVLISGKTIEWDSKRCSECGYKQPHKTNYCPNCGAKMDKECE